MDQLFQLHRQIQDLKQEVNSISQAANQLQRAEANNAQQLQNIQQLCNRLNQEVNVITNVAQQVSSQMINRPLTSGQYGTNISSQFGTGQYGNIGTMGTMANAGLYNQNQWSTYGNTQITPGDISSLSSHWGQGLNPQDVSVSSQFLSSQNRQFMPQSYGAAAYSTGMNQNIPYQHSASQYIPSYSTSLSTPNQQLGTSLSTPNQFTASMSIPSQFGASLSTPNQGISLSTPNQQLGTSMAAPSQFGVSLSTPNQGISLSTPYQFGTQSGNMPGTQYMNTSF